MRRLIRKGLANAHSTTRDRAHECFTKNRTNHMPGISTGQLHQPIPVVPSLCPPTLRASFWRMEMRRKQKIPPLIFECYPLVFWKDCCACAHQFRRERGWKKIATDIAFEPFRYLCASCGPDEKTALAIFEQRPWRGPMPKCAPPAPPKAAL